MESYQARLERAFEQRGLRPNTRRAYTQVVDQLSEYYDGRHPATMETEDIEAYFEHLRTIKKLAPKSLGVHRGALTFYFRTALGRPEVMLPIIRRRVPRTVPEILNRTEAEALLGAIRSPKIPAR